MTAMRKDSKRKAQTGKKLKSKSAKKEKASGKKPDIKSLINRFEFHRHGMAILPSSDDKRPGVAFFIKENNSDNGRTRARTKIYNLKFIASLNYWF